LLHRQEFFSMQIRPAKKNVVWKRAPLLRLFFPLTAGILTDNFYPVIGGFELPTFCGSFILFTFFISLPSLKKIGREWINGLIIQVSFFLFGAILMHLHRDIQIEDSAALAKNQSNYCLLRLLGDPAPKKESFKCIACITLLINDQRGYYENEKVLVYFNKKTDIGRIPADSRILIRKPLKAIENFASSGFDYKKYCRLKHIYAQVFLNENDFTIIQQGNEKSVLAGLHFLRKKLLLLIKNQIPDKTGHGLLEALLVGFTDDLDPVLLKSYADAGVIHIIAISGLHLALICHILQLFLRGTGPKNPGSWIKLTLLITGLWGYSLLAGGSPSVIRAATMFSLVLFAKNILRENSFYNTLAASAFMLICFDPYWIWDTGFQLSYAAVLGLGLFSYPIRNLLPLQNKILAGIWDAVSVSIAAQIITTPISIYYFHRFPSYFLLANLLAVPLSSVILVAGILLCICSPVYQLARLLGWLLGILIYFLNGLIAYISHLPGAVIGELDFSIPQLILVYFIMFSFYHFQIQKDKRWFLAGLGVICILRLSYLIH
jgi:competence protein ComEC